MAIRRGEIGGRRAIGAVVLALAGALAIGGAAADVASQATPVAGVAPDPIAVSPDLLIADAAVRYDRDLDVLVFDVSVEGVAGATVPEARGALDGAPVLGYVVPITLPAGAVGFRSDEGILALAVTSHPDFDDTPLWDEDGNGDFGDDGTRWHAHWVLVGPDERVPGGLAVLEVADAGRDALPPTSPDLPLFLDSPGFSVRLAGDLLRVVAPASRLGGETEFQFDAASAYLQVNATDPARPMLGVYDVYGVLSGDLSLPYQVEDAE